MSGPRKPPLLPAEILRRVLRLASFDGTSVLAVGGAFALLSAAHHDASGAAVSLAVAGAGAIEVHGVGLLRRGEDRGMPWLVASQLGLMALILGYALFRLQHVDTAPLQALLTDNLREAIAQAGLTQDEFLRVLYLLTYSIIALATLAYQGGMALYYLRRRAAVAAALRPEETSA